MTDYLADEATISEIAADLQDVGDARLDDIVDELERELRLTRQAVKYVRLRRQLMKVTGVKEPLP